MATRLEILEDSRKRVAAMKFGDEVTNICAGDGNPQKYAFFVKAKRNTVQCTNGKGKFWETGIEVVYPGTLSGEKCKELFDPVWQAIYGA